MAETVIAPKGMVVHPGEGDEWIVYKDCSCQEVMGTFPEKADAEWFARVFPLRLL